MRNKEFWLPRLFLKSLLRVMNVKKPLVVAIPYCLKKLGSRCVRMNVLRVDSWRVRNVFKSDNGVSYEALSSVMYKLSTEPGLDSRISFEQSPTAKKCLGGVDVEVSVKDGIATFRGEIFRISTIYNWRAGRTLLHDTRRASETIKQVFGSDC